LRVQGTEPKRELDFGQSTFGLAEIDLKASDLPVGRRIAWIGFYRGFISGQGLAPLTRDSAECSQEAQGLGMVRLVSEDLS